MCVSYVQHIWHIHDDIYVAYMGYKCNKKYVLWNVHLPNALHSVCLNRLSCTEVGIYNNANSPNGFLTTAVV